MECDLIEKENTKQNIDKYRCRQVQLQVNKVNTLKCQVLLITELILQTKHKKVIAD